MLAKLAKSEFLDIPPPIQMTGPSIDFKAPNTESKFVAFESSQIFKRSWSKIFLKRCASKTKSLATRAESPTLIFNSLMNPQTK